jgi:hypothetical protein
MNIISVILYCFLIIFIGLILYFYTNRVISSIRFKKKYNIKTSISAEELISHVVVYTLCIMNISVCIWALFNI